MSKIGVILFNRRCPWLYGGTCAEKDQIEAEFERLLFEKDFWYAAQSWMESDLIKAGVSLNSPQQRLMRKAMKGVEGIAGGCSGTHGRWSYCLQKRKQGLLDQLNIEDFQACEDLYLIHKKCRDAYEYYSQPGVREALSSPDSPVAGVPLHSEKKVKVESGILGNINLRYGQSVFKHYKELVAQGQEVLVCSYPDAQKKASPYAPPGSGFSVYKFWYEKVPYTRRQLRATSVTYSRPHPFLEIPEVAITSCPPGLENAKALRAKHWK